MIHLVLDTNIFTADARLRNSEFWVIENLAKAKFLTLHVPYVVEQEFLSQREQQVKDHVDPAIRSLGQLSKKALSPEINVWLKSALSSLQEKRKEIISSAGLFFEDWLKSIDAQKVSICATQSRAAMEAYFKGHPPFRQPKTRDDIPDSFIFQAIRKIANEIKGSTICFVSADKKLRMAAADLPSVAVFETLRAFVASDEAQSAIESNDPLGNLSFIKSRLAITPEHSSGLMAEVKSLLGEEVIWKTLEYTGWSNNSDEATITSYGEPEDPNFDWSDLEYYGEKRFVLPFNVNLPVTATFYIYKADYWIFEEDEGYLPAVSDHNDHVYEAEAEIMIKVEGRLAFEVNSNHESKEFEVDFETAEIDSVWSIEVCE